MTCAAKPLRCVIVDDNPEFIVAAANVLERNGITIVGATTQSAEALRCVEQLHPDVTLVDVDLGGESGFDVVEQLHERVSATSPPALILMSAHDGLDFADLINASPAIGFLPKLTLSAEAIRELLCHS